MADGGAVGIAIGGVAVVCCPHNREKRLRGRTLFDAAKTKAHLCACCENVFLEPSDTPRLRDGCRRPPIHMLGGPLPDPTGVI